MKRLMGGIAAAVLLLGLMAAPATAQIDKFAVYHSPALGTGVMVSGDVGFGVNDDAKLVAGETPMAFGGRITLGLPVVQLQAGAALVNPGGGADKEIGFGGNAAVSIFNVPLVPVAVDLQAGVGYIKFGSLKQLDVPIGVGFGFKPETPGVTVEPWVAPRVHIMRVEVAGISNSEVGFGASGGLNITLPAGFGFHAAVDWLTIGDPSVSPLVVSAGAHFKFAVPSLGMAKGLVGN